MTGGLERALEVYSWDGSLVTYPRKLVTARAIEHVAEVMRDPGRYPSPVRPRGSGHSPANCGEADGGTVLDMRGLNRILEVGRDTITAEAGALYIDLAKELESHDLQLHVNTEIGCLTVGSAACCATKDASMPGELGQISSYVAGMKLVTASGDVLEITDDDPELLRVARSSYGLLGIVCEVTLRTRPLQQLAVSHKTYTVREFVERLPELLAGDESLMFYLYPFVDRVSVEFRKYVGELGAGGVRRADRATWWLRNLTWRLVTPGVGYLAERYIPWPAPRYRLIDGFDRTLHVMVDRVLKSRSTVPPDQMIRYPARAGRTGFTSSIWAFPQDAFATVLPEWCEFMRRHERERGWRPNMLAVGYRIEHDTSSLLSYSWDGPVLTIDPVSTGTPGWADFLDAFNAFSSERGGSPLLNQTRQITAEQARRAFGDRLDTLEDYRRRYDPDGRLLNGFFRELLAPEAASAPSTSLPSAAAASRRSRS